MWRVFKESVLKSTVGVCEEDWVTIVHGMEVNGGKWNNKRVITKKKNFCSFLKREGESGIGVQYVSRRLSTLWCM